MKGCATFNLLAALLLATASSHAQQRGQRPDAGAAPAAPVQKRQLSNGLRVWIVEQHELPVAQMSLVVPAGTDADPPGKYGTASLTSAMLTEGAGARSAVEIADALDAMLANLSATTDVDSTSLQLYVPVLRVPEALALMADAAQRPTFPTGELETLRQQRLGTLRNARENPDAVAALAFARSSYGTHRSSAPLIGTADSLRTLAVGDLRAFHAAAYRPDTSTLIVIGDFTPEQVLPQLETHFGKWQAPGAGRAAAGTAQAPPRHARQVIFIDTPGAPQSRIVIGGVGPANSMASFFPMQVLNTVVKGRLTSDRSPALRDFTAGVRSGFDMRKSATPFVVSTAAQADKTGESLKALLDELAGVAKGVPADELTRAKDEYTRDFPKTFEAAGRISSRLRTLQSLIVYGLPDDYYANYASAIQAVGEADVQRVAGQYIDPDHLTIVIVGDRKTVEPAIRALNLGSITAMTVDEVFAPAK